MIALIQPGAELPLLIVATEAILNKARTVRRANVNMLIRVLTMKHLVK